MGFEQRADAERLLQEWKERLSKFGLKLHPDKARLIEFGRFAAEDRKRRGEGKPETFNFLGFTHICAKNQKTGGFSVDRKTIRKRLSAKLKAVREELRRRWHEPVAEVGKWLRSVVQGYFNYHAVPGNIDSLQSFRAQVFWHWSRALQRRSQKSRMPWERFGPLVAHWIPSAVILHPRPAMRFGGGLHKQAAEAVSLVAGQDANLRGVADAGGDFAGKNRGDEFVAARLVKNEGCGRHELAASGKQDDVLQKFERAGAAAILV